MAVYNFVINFIVTSSMFHFYFDPIKFNESRQKSYDFIVIGAGSAGSLVAARLSQVPQFNVLLLERGGSAGNFFTEIPYVSRVIGYEEPLVKIFRSSRQRLACGNTDGICLIYAGAGFGGGSTHNAMVWSRGSPKDFDDRQNKYGAKGWSYADVVPHFKNVENYLNKTLARNPLLGKTPNATLVMTPISYPNSSSIILNAFAEGGFEIGNYNGKRPARVSVTQSSLGHGRRSSSWNTFLKPVIKRTNLDIVPFAAVNRINFDSDKKAVSVSYTKDGVHHEVKVSKEVILSAGVIDSPKILLLSGVGDREELMEVGVTPTIHLPSVGKSFQDQPEIVVNLTAHEPTPSITYGDFEEYRKSKNGPLSKNSHIVIAFVKDRLRSVNGNDTKLQYEFYLDYGLKKSQFPGQFIVEITNVAPRSRGSIRLKSNDPNDDPVIDPNYLADETDKEIFRRGIRRFIGLVAESKVLKNEGIKIRSINIPGCGTLTGDKLISSDDFLDCFTKMNTHSGIHMSSSCRMGSRDDPLSVVDPQLRLLGGAKNVRVMDASVMPQVTRGNTNAPTIMIADKGSRMLIDFHLNGE